MVTQNVDFLPFGRFLTLETYMLSEERECMFNALTRANWNYSATARAVGLTARSIRYRVEKCGLIDKAWGGKVRPYANRQSLFDKAWPALRMRALKQHGARCQCCGATAKDGKRIHVDHVKPRKHYPELALDISNLQVLCADCNLSKSSKDQTDWR